MSRGPCTFKQLDVTRALRATQKAGIAIQRVEIGKDGKIVLVVIEPADDTSTPSLAHEIVL